MVRLNRWRRRAKVPCNRGGLHGLRGRLEEAARSGEAIQLQRKKTSEAIVWYKFVRYFFKKICIS